MTFQAWKHMWHMWIIRWSAGPATDAWVPSDDEVCGISGTFPLQPMAFERGAFHVAPEGRSIHLQRHWNTCTWTTDPTGSPKPPPLIYSASEPLSVPIGQTLLSRCRLDRLCSLGADWTDFALGADWTDSRRNQNKWARTESYRCIMR